MHGPNGPQQQKHTASSMRQPITLGPVPRMPNSTGSMGRGWAFLNAPTAAGFMNHDPDRLIAAAQGQAAHRAGDGQAPAPPQQQGSAANGAGDALHKPEGHKGGPRTSPAHKHLAFSLHWLNRKIPTGKAPLYSSARVPKRCLPCMRTAGRRVHCAVGQRQRLQGAALRWTDKWLRLQPERQSWRPSQSHG